MREDIKRFSFFSSYPVTVQSMEVEPVSDVMGYEGMLLIQSFLRSSEELGRRGSLKDGKGGKEIQSKGL